MPTEPLPPSVVRLLWDVDPDRVDPHRDRFLIFERVMSRGTWDAMVWLRASYTREQLSATTSGVRIVSRAPGTLHLEMVVEPFCVPDLQYLDDAPDLAAKNRRAAPRVCSRQPRRPGRQAITDVNPNRGEVVTDPVE